MTDTAQIAHALSDPLRIEILDLLAQARNRSCCSPANPDMPEGICACDLAPRLGGMAPSKLAYHLKILRDSGLIGEQRRGKWVYYMLDEQAVVDFARATTDRFTGSRESTARRHRRGRRVAAAAKK